MKETTIKLICLMEGDFENVQYKGTNEDFIDNLYKEKFIEIYSDSKRIFLNTDYIMSFELGDNFLSGDN